MPLNLNPVYIPGLPGLTFFSDSRLGQWAKPTGIYLPPSVDLDQGVVNVLLYLHGWYVPNIEYLFSGDRAQVRRQVIASGKSVVLVAPYLGHGGSGTTYNAGGLTGHWGELYLNQVLNTLGMMQDPDTYVSPAELSDMSAAGLAAVTNFSPRLRLGKLVIACHSGGGEGMRGLVGALGRYKRNLAECWGFDCLYGAKVVPGVRDDDATFWYNWATGGDGRPLYISYGSSTAPQSVKLYLMGKGFAISEGDRRDPKGPEVMRLDVKLGIPTARPINDLMGLDGLMATTPTPRHPPRPGNKFVEQAANNLRKNAGWPGDLMEMHYAIARDGLLERLKGAGFL